jgi:hypothetical protein
MKNEFISWKVMQLIKLFCTSRSVKKWFPMVNFLWNERFYQTYVIYIYTITGILWNKTFADDITVYIIIYAVDFDQILLRKNVTNENENDNSGIVREPMRHRWLKVTA